MIQEDPRHQPGASSCIHTHTCLHITHTQICEMKMGLLCRKIKGWCCRVRDSAVHGQMQCSVELAGTGLLRQQRVKCEELLS